MAGYDGRHSGPVLDKSLYAMGSAPDFMEKLPESPYLKNSFVTYGEKMYRLDASVFSGPWDATKWTETNAIDEIRNLRNAHEGLEHVYLHMSVNKGTGVVAGKTVTIGFAAGSTGVPFTKTLDASGNCDFYVNYGDWFRIEPSAMSGYMVLKSSWEVALRNEKSIDMKYIFDENGYYIIDTDKKITPFADWDTTYNNKAAFVLCANSNKNILISKTFTTASRIFMPEYVDCPLIPNIGSALDANADFAGKSKSDTWTLWATTPDASSGETPVQKYNRTQGKSYTLDDYLAAVRYCYNSTKTFDSSTLHGYLPAMGELRYMCDNKTAISNVLSTIGGSTFPNLSSGYWWSCSERNSNFCWLLNNGSTDDRNKTSSGSVFPLYALSDLNL